MMITDLLLKLFKYGTCIIMVTLIVLAAMHSDKAGINKLGDYYELHEDPFQITIR